MVTAILHAYAINKYHYERLVEEANKMDLKTKEGHDGWLMTFFQAGCFLKHAIDFTAALQAKGGPFVGFLQEENDTAENVRAAIEFFEKNYQDWNKVIDKMEENRTKDGEEKTEA